jgi:hypothetical protein
VADDWRHLVPLVDALVERGNAVVGEGFAPTQGGFECEMTRPLDFDVLRTLVPQDDKNIHLAPSSDLMWCSHCWASVFGPNRLAGGALDEP